MSEENHVEQAFLEHLIKLMVTKPEMVEITRTVDDLGILLTLKVDKDDMGRIIGKDGQTAKSIRTLLRVIGSRHEERVNLKILEPEGSDHEMAPHPTPGESPQADESPATESEEAPQEQSFDDSTAMSGTDLPPLDLGDDIDI